jgi:hypothetical protein
MEESTTRMLHILEHSTIWVNGDFLMDKYLQLEIIRVEQTEGTFVHLAKYGNYHWGINLKAAVTEVVFLQNKEWSLPEEQQPTVFY